MRNVLITGCSTGIGRAAALDLAGRGWRVFATVRNDADAQALARDAQGAALLPLRLDVCDPDSVATAAATVEAELDGAALDGLVNNAGVAIPGPLEFLPLEAFERQLAVNLTGVLRVTQAFLPSLRRSQNARIVMISSISGRVATPMVGAYNASKFGLEGMSDALRRELLDHGIQVSVVQPGKVQTAIWGTANETARRLRSSLSPKAMEYYAELMSGVTRSSPERPRNAIPAQEVAKVIRHALEHRRPRLRYLVGRDAKAAARWQRWLPARWLDRGIVAFTKKG